MGQLSSRLTLNINGRTKNFSSTKGYSQILEVEQEVDSSDSFVDVVNFTSTKGTSSIPASKGFCIYNMGRVPCEVQYKLVDWKDNSNVDEANSVDLGPGSATTTRYITKLLPSGAFLWEDNARMVSYAEDASGANGTSLDNQVPDGNMYVDSTANVDSATAAGVVSSGSATRVYLEPYTSATNCAANLFMVGDLIRCTNEIMEVTAIGDKSDLANNYLDVKRGMFGSTAASDHSDADAVLIPFFNMTGKFNKYSTSQTDSSGRFHAKNFFGYGRTLTSVADGIVPGSVAIKFYNQGYQELGLSGITSSTDTGLTAGTTYQFTIAVDGGSAYDADVTIDSSNTKFGGQNGLIGKLNELFRTQYYTSGNLFQKKVTASIVGGDIRFTSGSHLSTSAISLGDSSGGDTDIWGAGRIPAVADIEGAVASKLPDDTVRNKSSYISEPNSSVFATDDGLGNIKGTATGTINYQTGEVNFSGPAEAHFVVSASYNSAHSGGVSTETNNFNNLQSIGLRSTNSKINTTVRVEVFN